MDESRAGVVTSGNKPRGGTAVEVDASSSSINRSSSCSGMDGVDCGGMDEWMHRLM